MQENIPLANLPIQDNTANNTAREKSFASVETQCDQPAGEMDIDTERQGMT